VEVVRKLLQTIVLVFFVTLLLRFVIDWIRVFAREWVPRGPALVVAEGVYTATDPPLKFLRRFIPPLRLGGVSIDFAFMVLFFVCVILLQVL
jgi:YggT family protein